ncbi:amidase [Candidatus Fermentibacteria bacterium]|nr:amidase [Candidatus Fermentibacteria bacterium]
MAEYPLLNPALLASDVVALRSDASDLVAHIEAACNLIEKVDRRIHAFLPEPNRRERLREEARRLRETSPDPTTRPPLFGVMVGVKDIFHVEGLPTRAGSRLPHELFKGEEAAVVRCLRDAGAFVLGKTITTEFAFFQPGPTRNPHDPSHTPGGSSSGSAAAVAAGLCHVAVGTQTIGSIIRPAAYCGVVGFKPSLGRVSTTGIVSFSASADTVGFFTQDVEGMAHVAAAAIPDWRAEAPSTSPPVLGIPAGPYLAQAHPEGLAGFRECVTRLRGAGCAIEEAPLLPTIDKVNRRHRRMVAAEFAHVHREWFASHGSLYGPATRDLILEGQTVSAAELAEARAGMRTLREEMEEAMVRHGVDLWISPSAQGEAPEGLSSTGNPIMNLPWTHGGMPALSLPAGRGPRGLPLGLQLVAPFGADERLLMWASALQDVIPAP